MSRGWTKGQKARFQATMLAKKTKKVLKENDFMTPVGHVQEGRPAVDIDKMCEFHYRRGLITALDVILRELR